MSKKNTKNIITSAFLVVFVAGLFILLSFVNPGEIIERIGVNNGYALAFLVSLFGGFSAGGSISFISILITLTVGGLHPIYLGLLAGMGLVIGDMIMFFAGSKGRSLVGEKLKRKIDGAVQIFERKKWLRKITPFAAYLYIGFAPLPNDILLLFLAAIGYPRKKMNIIIFLGDITFSLMITTLTSKGINVPIY